VIEILKANVQEILIFVQLSTVNCPLSTAIAVPKQIALVLFLLYFQLRILLQARLATQTVGQKQWKQWKQSKQSKQ
jgi:hypothetical protein